MAIKRTVTTLQYTRQYTHTHTHTDTPNSQGLHSPRTPRLHDTIANRRRIQTPLQIPLAPPTSHHGQGERRNTPDVAANGAVAGTIEKEDERERPTRETGERGDNIISSRRGRWTNRMAMGACHDGDARGMESYY